MRCAGSPGRPPVVGIVGWAALATAAVVVVAIGWAMVDGVVGGWQPVGDEAVIAVRAADTFSSHPPLVGPPTSLSVAAREPVSHPGPLQLWLLAPFVRLLGPEGALVGTAVLNMGWVVGIVAVGWRHAGRGFALLTAVFVALLVSALGGHMLRDPYNPWAAVLPTALCALLAWRAASGDRWALPAAVAVGSFAAQTHLSFLPVSAALVGFAVLVLCGDAVRDRRRGRRDRVSGVGAPVVAALLVGVVCWSGPLVDQVSGDGNLAAILRAGGGDGERVGWLTGVDGATGMLGWPPRWLDRPGLDEVLVRPDWAVRTTAAFSVAALVAVGVGAWRRGDARLVRLVAVAAVGLAAATATTAAIVLDANAGLNVSNRLSWWPTAMIAWLALAWGTVLAGRRVVGRTALVRRPGLVAVVALAALVGAGLLARRTLADVAVAQDPQSGYFGPAVYLADRLAERGGGPYRLSGADWIAEDGLAPALVAQLEARDIDVRVDDDLSARLGRHRRATGDEVETILLRASPDADEPFRGRPPLAVYDRRNPPDGYERFATYSRAIFGQRALPVSLTILRGGRAAG